MLKGLRERYWVILLGVWLAAFSVRLLYLWQIHNAPFFDLRIGDAEAYHEWAKRIAAGDWLGRGVFYQAPLYPYFLAAVYRILDDSILTVRLTQACLGAGSCALLAAAGISLFGRRGAIAGVGLALYPPAIFLDGLAEKTCLATFFTTALIAALATSPERMTTRRWLGAGTILGLLGLTRENALILVFPVLLWIVFGHFPKAWRATLIFAAGCVLVLFPVGLRNLIVGGEFHLTTSQFGPNFYIGNHPGARGTYEGLVEGHGSVLDEREDATRLVEQAFGRTTSPAEVSMYWAGRSFSYIRSEPVAWLRLIARKFALTFNAAELSDTESPSVYADSSWLLRILQPFDFGLLLGMAALGVTLTIRSWRRLWFLYALAGVYAMSVVLFYVFARYRFPLVPILMVLAAGGLDEVIDRVRMRRFRDSAIPGAVTLGAILFAHLPLESPDTSRATHYLSIALAMSKDAQHADQALGFYQRALDAAPDFPAAQMGIGLSLARAGRSQDAIPHLQNAVRFWPNYAEAHYNLGKMLAATGRSQEAVHEFGEALRVRPDDADTHFALGKTLTVLNNPGEAILQYRRAVELDPNNAAAHNDLGSTLANQGEIAEALSHFERALALDPNQSSAKVNLEQARRILASQIRK